MASKACLRVIVPAAVPPHLSQLFFQHKYIPPGYPKYISDQVHGAGATAPDRYHSAPPGAREASRQCVSQSIYPLGTQSNSVFVRAPFSLQTPVERSERVAGCWAVRARANPLSLGVWHFTLRFVWPGVGLATRAEGRKAVACSRPLDPRSTQSLPAPR